jgi:hypothetical protein
MAGSKHQGCLTILKKETPYYQLLLFPYKCMYSRQKNVFILGFLFFLPGAMNNRLICGRYMKMLYHMQQPQNTEQYMIVTVSSELNKSCCRPFNSIVTECVWEE